MAALFTDDRIRLAVWHLFNSDLKASQATLAGYLREMPLDPLAHALWAAVPFYHYVSMRIPEKDTQSIVGLLLGPGVAMPPAMQKEIGQALRRSQTLAAHADDSNALLALCVVEGVNRDGLALVSKRWTASLAHAERAHRLARRLVERKPPVHDAYFVLGSTEYLMSRIPTAVRLFTHIDGVSGDRAKAIALYQIAAKSGWVFREFARRALVNLYVDEGRTADAVNLLGELVDEFPENRLLRADWMKLRP